VRFIPRVIREAVAQSEWEQAGMALTRLEECQSVEWSVDALAQELCHPTSVVSAAAGFEALELPQVDEFIAFARRFGESAVDLLGLMMAGTEGSRHERRLMDAIIDECRENPERLAPWLGDPRWTVVRDTVRILGGIGGDSIAGLLRAVAEHPEQAVRDEVVTALEGVTLALAKPMLISLLDDVDSRTFCSIIQRLGQVRDAEVAELLVGYVTHPEFERQPADERRAIFAAIVTAGGDRALPELEAELHKGSLFSGGDESLRQAVAKCIAQIGTPLAKQVLQRGARSHQAGLRQTCEASLARFGRS
jgi:HEAT repeat protein